MAYRLHTLDRLPELKEQIDLLSSKSWPEFLLHADAHEWDALFEEFAPFQLLLTDADGLLLAVGHTVPLVWDGSTADLPKTIAEVLARAKADRAAGREPSTLSALAVMIRRSHRGRGLSPRMVRSMVTLAARHGLHSLIAPVRPAMKSLYPLTAFERYVEWTRPDGAPFDPWIRVHWRLGAKQLVVAPRALTVTGSVAEWEKWTGLSFPESGPYVVPGALQPIQVDRERDEGRYEDPNIWMRHSVASKEQTASPASGELS